MNEQTLFERMTKSVEKCGRAFRVMMYDRSVVVDTHIVLWYLLEPEKL